MWEDNIRKDLREISFDVWHLNHTNLNEQQPKVQPSAVQPKPAESNRNWSNQTETETTTYPV
jgi:hypothetical protein